MPMLHSPALLEVALQVLKSAGASDQEARTVADHMIGANLAGHDSHGVILLSTYVERIRKGHIRPGAPFQVVQETPTTAVVNGNWGFGQVVSTRATELCIAKARSHQIAAVTVFQQSHVGRLADYPLMAAREGMVGLMTCDSGRTSKSVAPFGGRGKLLGTNPICIAIPSDLPGPVFIDMATSAVAANKIRLYEARGQPLPQGWIMDQDGRPSTDPKDFFQGGALLPVGGDQAHKGYGLSFMVEVFSGLLTGLGFGHDPDGPHNDGSLILAFRVDAFQPLERFKRDVHEFVSYLKSASPAPGFDEVLYPGEPEYRTSRKRQAEGVPIEDETYARLRRLVDELGLPATLLPGVP
ncbi:MAG: Ldh family oxidoreductase [Chloroflexi bacterium]|nr:Ldh family oxidoreductase [Chloroflexota bacterium]